MSTDAVRRSGPTNGSLEVRRPSQVDGDKPESLLRERQISIRPFIIASGTRKLKSDGTGQCVFCKSGTIHSSDKKVFCQFTTSFELEAQAITIRGEATSPNVEVVTPRLLQAKLLSGYAVTKHSAGTFSANYSPLILAR
ncbi:unnamed protein product [Symbiodinium natans]|uniref:Uncharacterized protein n=1 Tax=Symbiodinium natans TaxID=878477 RepID=A0A812S472_9DINO|nr:unnamed protein product [Symbiodinium natans]